MTRFTDYTEAIASGGAVFHWRHELVSSDGQLLATTDPDPPDETISWGAEAQPLGYSSVTVSQRTMSLSVPVTDPSLVPDGPSSILHPDAGSRVRVAAGVENGGVTVWWDIATMEIAEVDGLDHLGVAVLTLGLVDTLDPARSNLTSHFSFEDGETVEAVAGRLLAQVIPEERFSLTPTGYTMPSGSLSPPANRWEAINSMLEGCGHELSAEPNGLVISRPIPDSGIDVAAERWEYGGPNGISVQDVRRLWRPRVPRAWELQGGAAQSISAEATVVVYDTDPTSEGFFRGDEVAATVESSRYPYARTVNQLIEAGYAQLRRHGIGPAIVEFKTIPNPAIQPGDLIDFESERLKLSGTFRVLSFSLPIQVDGLMTVEARQTYDPALNYEPPLDKPEGCLVSYSDSFNGANRNLEDTDIQAGSLDWSEIGRSWGIVSEKVVQRADNRWCFGFVNTPLCASDQYAEIEIDYIPSGRFAGPMVRSTGTTIDGYAALIDSSGRLSLEMWLNGSRSAQLGQHNSGSSPAGRTIRLRAIGSAIEVLLNSTVVITAIDDRRTGPHVGMLALGGTLANPLRCDNFAAGPA